MKKFLLFLPIVGYNNFYIINNSELLVCGNESIKAVNFNWSFGDNGLFKNISKFTNEMCAVRLFISVNMKQLCQI